MRYRVTHITEYLYHEPVSHCFNLANVIPRSTKRQRCTNNRVTVEPAVASCSQSEDYFGNMAYHFEIQRSHKKLSICSESDIKTGPQTLLMELDQGITCGDALAHMATSTDVETLMAKEYLFNSPIIQSSEALKAYALPLFAEDRPLLDAVMAFTQQIFDEFTYCPKSTHIGTPLPEVLEKKRGVCQDFAHLQIGCLRALGFPAKYVSGYIETLPPPGKEKLVGSDASHAWISVYCPSEGWIEFDPTNRCLVGEQHIITAWGRDYSDVAPLKGVIYGGGEAPIMNVSVDVTQVE